MTSIKTICDLRGEVRHCMHLTVTDSSCCCLARSETRCENAQWNHKNFLHSRQQSKFILLRCANVTQILMLDRRSVKARRREQPADGFRHQPPQRNDPKNQPTRSAVAIIFNQTLIAQCFVHVKRLMLLLVMIIDAA